MQRVAGQPVRALMRPIAKFRTISVSVSLDLYRLWGSVFLNTTGTMQCLLYAI